MIGVFPQLFPSQVMKLLRRKRGLEALCHKCQDVFVQSRRRPILSEMIKQFDSQWEASAMFPKLDSNEESYRTDRFREVCGR